MKNLHFRSLRRFLVVWSGAIGLAFLLLTLVAGLTLRRLDGATRDAAHYAARLQDVQEFENAALEANRRTDGRVATDVAAPQSGEWARANAALRRLKQSGHTADLSAVESTYRALQTVSDPRLSWREERPFLDELRAYRRAEFDRVTRASQHSARLYLNSRGVLLALLVLSLVGLVAGGIELWARVFGPLITLSRAVRRFGNGDLKARAELSHADEIGELGAVWNDMAASIETREAERLRFVAAVAHDLKNPLMVVGMAAVMMHDKPDKFSPAQRADWLEKIAANARRMEAMIADLTGAVEAQTGALQLQWRAFDLAAIARECADETALIFPDHNLVCQCEAALGIEGDCARLQRAIANLLSNAAKYSAPATQITVALQRDGQRAILEVRDQGAGIAPEDIKRLFTPFVRLERTEKTAHGTGLGLATTQKIIEAHGGQLQVESELGVGSTFRVSLPVKQAKKQTALRMEDAMPGFQSAANPSASIKL